MICVSDEGFEAGSAPGPTSAPCYDAVFAAGQGAAGGSATVAFSRRRLTCLLYTSDAADDTPCVDL
eukprot:2534117-Pyramimonas_sp.AAC.1